MTAEGLTDGAILLDEPEVGRPREIGDDQIEPDRDCTLDAPGELTLERRCG